MKTLLVFTRRLLTAAISLTLLAATAPSHAQTWHWAIPSAGRPALIETDTLGNYYVAGTFSGTATFGPFSLTSAGGEDVYVGRLDSLGAWQWVQQLGGTGADDILRLRLDAPNHAVLLVGTAGPAATVGQQPIPTGDFVARISATSGAARWAVAAPEVTDAGADVAGNVVVCGTFVDSLTLGAFTVRDSVFSFQEVYVGGLDSVGTWQWLTHGGGNGNIEAELLAVAPNGEVIVTSSGSNFFGAYSWPTFGFHDVICGYVDEACIVAKLDAAHTWQWVGCFGGRGEFVPEDVQRDDLGNIYLLSNGSGNTYYNTTALFELPDQPNHLLCVLSLSPNGNVRWVARQDTSTIGTQTQAFRIRVIKGNKLLLTGYMAAGNVQLGNYLLNSSGFSNFPHFLAILDGSGNWQWAELFSDDYGWGCATWQLDRITFAGNFFQPSYIFGSTVISSTSPSGALQGFVAQRGLPALIDSVSPATGPTGTVVTLTGVGFVGTTAVLVGGVPAVFTVLGNGQVQITIPPGLPTGGAGVLIQVVGPNGTSLSPTRFQPRPVGLAETSAPLAFQLAPNPARGDVRVVGLPAAAQLTVLDCAGRVVSATTVGADATLHLHGLAPGVYTVRAGATARRLVVE